MVSAVFLFAQITVLTIVIEIIPYCKKKSKPRYKTYEIIKYKVQSVLTFAKQRVSALPYFMSQSPIPM